MTSAEKSFTELFTLPCMQWWKWYAVHHRLREMILKLAHKVRSLEAHLGVQGAHIHSFSVCGPASPRGSCGKVLNQRQNSCVTFEALCDRFAVLTVSQIDIEIMIWPRSWQIEWQCVLYNPQTVWRNLACDNDSYSFSYLHVHTLAYQWLICRSLLQITNTRGIWHCLVQYRPGQNSWQNLSIALHHGSSMLKRLFWICACNFTKWHPTKIYIWLFMAQSRNSGQCKHHLSIQRGIYFLKGCHLDGHQQLTIVLSVLTCKQCKLCRFINLPPEVIQLVHFLTAILNTTAWWLPFPR